MVIFVYLMINMTFNFGSVKNSCEKNDSVKNSCDKKIRQYF